MIKNYKCSKCGKDHEINIPTYDIHTRGKHSLAIDQVKLQQRIDEPRHCECGGLLEKQYADFGKPLFVKVDKQRFR